MRVFHVIPGAFDYFDDISDKAFKMVEGLTDVGVDVDAMTVQYGTTKKSTIQHVTGVASSREYLGNVSLTTALEKAVEYDIIHMHCPIFGGVSGVLKIKRDYPDKPLVVTVYRKVIYKDLFSVVVKFYDWLYRPLILKAADAVVPPDAELADIADLYADLLGI